MKGGTKEKMTDKKGKPKTETEDLLDVGIAGIPEPIGEADFNLVPISPDGKVLRDEFTGAIFTLEFNVFSGSHDLKRHNAGIPKFLRDKYG